MFFRAVLYFWWMQTMSHALKQMEQAQHHVRWIQHMDGNGVFYYEDIIDDTVTWMAPVGEEYIPWVDKDYVQ